MKFFPIKYQCTTLDFTQWVQIMRKEKTDSDNLNTVRYDIYIFFLFVLDYFVSDAILYISFSAFAYVVGGKLSFVLSID